MRRKKRAVRGLSVILDTDICVTVELDIVAGKMENSARLEDVAYEEGVVREPYVGMEFDSEDAAKKFYSKYAKRAGFVMRIDQCRRSQVDKRILSRRLSCNKQGYYVKMKDHFGPKTKPRASTREGCNAMILVKVNTSGSWVVTKFEKDHSHPLLVSIPPCNATDPKDRRIQELTMELERLEQLCNLYREQIFSFLKTVEEQTEYISTKIQEVVDNVRDIEIQLNKAPNN